MMETIKLNSVDGYELSLIIYEIENPKGYIQIIHGMQEHQKRYSYLAEKLNNAGYTVITSDMRAHGPNAPILGYFSEKNGYKLILEDQKTITKYIKEKYDTNKVYLLGHSMGSIIARNLLQTESNDYEKVILSGYPNYQSAVKLGILLGKLIRFFKGGSNYSKLLNNLSVGSFHKKIKNYKTKLDWLSVNEENVNKYISDPYCGFKFSISAFIDLFTLLARMNDKKLFINVNSIPILLIGGGEDPCIGGLKGKNSSIKALEKCGFKNLTVIDYPTMRHEILNEKDKDTVINDIITFL